MLPTFSGHTNILSSICDHLPPSDLSRVLRADRELSLVACRPLYRYLTVHENPGSKGVPPASLFLVDKLDAEEPVPFLHVLKSAILLSVRTLDITEECAATIKCSPLSALKTVVLRAAKEAVPTIRWDIIRAPFGAEWKPERLVFVGSTLALLRVLGCSHQPGDSSGSRSWDALRRLEHLSPFKAARASADPYLLGQIEIADRLPSVVSYDVFYDVHGPLRTGDGAAEIPEASPWSQGKNDISIERNLPALGLLSIILDARSDIGGTQWLPSQFRDLTRQKEFIRQACHYLAHLRPFSGPLPLVLLWAVLIIDGKAIETEQEAALGAILDGGAVQEQESLFPSEKEPSPNRDLLLDPFDVNADVGPIVWDWFPDPAVVKPRPADGVWHFATGPSGSVGGAFGHATDGGPQDFAPFAADHSSDEESEWDDEDEEDEEEDDGW